ncbi:DUF6233 domain-containing protein [Streptomyces boncukensis]|nr:DUF6233 domain-containing protein [Streptomyces boncukensis]
MPVRYVSEDGTTEQKAGPTPISVHADCITPIPGEDYRAVPTVGAEEGRQWVAVQTRGTRGRGLWWALHHRTCWSARGGWQARRITAAEARDLLAASGWVCDMCRPDALLDGQALSPEPGSQE